MAKTSRDNDRKVIREPQFIGEDFSRLKLGLVESIQTGVIDFFFPHQCPKCGSRLCVEVGKTGHKQFEITTEGGYGKEIENQDDCFYESPNLFCSKEGCGFDFRIEELGDSDDRKTKTYKREE